MPRDNGRSLCAEKLLSVCCLPSSKTLQSARVRLGMSLPVWPCTRKNRSTRLTVTRSVGTGCDAVACESPASVSELPELAGWDWDCDGGRGCDSNCGGASDWDPSLDCGKMGTVSLGGASGSGANWAHNPGVPGERIVSASSGAASRTCPAARRIHPIHPI